MHNFLVQNGPFAPKFFWKIINIILIYLLAPFIVQNFKKFFQQIQSYEDAQILGPKQSIPPPKKKWNFFQKTYLMSIVSFIHAYLNAKNRSQILIY